MQQDALVEQIAITHLANLPLVDLWTGLSTDLRQIALGEAVLGHHIAQHFMPRDIGDGVVPCIIGNDQVAHRRGQSGSG